MKWLLPIFSPPTGTYGGLTRVIAVAQAAQAAGHEVRFCAAGEQADTLQKHGFFVYEVPMPTMLGLPGPLSRVVGQIAPHVAPPVRSGRSIGDIWMVLYLTGCGREGFLRRRVQAQLAIVADYQPDVLFTDLDPAAFLLAVITGLPLACTYQDIVQVESPFTFPRRMLDRAAANILHSHGLPARTMPELCFAPHVLKAIPSVPELDGADPARPDIFYAGHLLGDLKPPEAGGFVPEPGKRYVFVYIGTGSIPFGRLERVLPEVFPAGEGLICMVGAQCVAEPYRRGNVVFQPFVDAVSLLPHCDWVICHGGQNTIAQALLHGVPLIVLPGAVFERRFNAERVAATGAGVMGERAEFNAAWLRDVLARRAEFVPQAKALGDQIKAYGGSAGVVAAVEGWVRGGDGAP